MNEILVNNYEKELMVLASGHGLGMTAVILNSIKKYIKNNKKVLLFSLETSEDEILKRMRIDANDNLVIKDKPNVDIEYILKNIDEIKPDIVIIDYLQLLNETKDVIFDVLKRTIETYNIPIIITSQLSINNDSLDLGSIDINEFISHNPNFQTIINECDTFAIIYRKAEKEHIIKYLKGNKEDIDIREILN
jgi:thymidine kinase